MPESYAETYARNGVVKIPKLLSQKEIEAVRAAIAQYIRYYVPTLPEADYVLEADGESVRNLWRMEEHDSFFADLAQRPELCELLRPLLNGDPVLMGVETFNKPSKVGSGVPPHQDNAYFCLTPPDALTVWIAIDPVTKENGPVTHVPGSHRGGILPHKKSGVSGNSMGLAEPLDDHKTYSPTLEPGDALIHHSETIHYSGPNNSDHARCVLLLVFRGSHCTVEPALKEAYQSA